MPNLLAGLAAFVLLQDPTGAAQRQDPEVYTVPDVNVVGRTTEEAATQFVDHVSAPPLGTRLARWNGRLCLSMRGGFPAGLAQGLIDRIAMRAVELDIDVEGPECRPNVFLFAGDDGAQLAQNLMTRDPKLFQKHMHFGQDLGREALNDFLTSDAPVRWWQVTFPVVPSTGFVISDPPGDDPQTIAVHSASRIRSNIRYDLAWAVVVIETPQMRGVSLDALSDYVAMIVLAQIDPSANMRGYDSILNLFEPGNEQREASQWDLDYLTALYRTSPDLMSPDQQTRWVAQRLARERRGDDER